MFGLSEQNISHISILFTLKCVKDERVAPTWVHSNILCVSASVTGCLVSLRTDPISHFYPLALVTMLQWTLVEICPYDMGCPFHHKWPLL